ncbi:hypothetical protein KI688_002595 [Linnemannia hyalina]|uniref:Uncharacterized protein n=1 Tax=Linnemannia hyalina TaxID=64524 RepID=A0A9P7XRD7_9FUNG|nr:hypothetical protein KI688_002595 [Linnemannia hyalina]
MKIEILLLGLAASVAAALPARNQTGTLSSFARNSTHTSPNAVSAQDCKSSTLRWWRDPQGAGDYNSLLSFTLVGNYYRGAILPHEDPMRRTRYCSGDGMFCVTHGFGPVEMDVILEFGNRKYYYKDPSYVHKLQIGYADWDVEYWDCVAY